MPSDQTNNARRRRVNSELDVHRGQKTLGNTKKNILREQKKDVSRGGTALIVLAWRDWGLFDKRARFAHLLCGTGIQKRKISTRKTRGGDWPLKCFRRGRRVSGNQAWKGGDTVLGRLASNAYGPGRPIPGKTRRYGKNEMMVEKEGFGTSVLKNEEILRRTKKHNATLQLKKKPELTENQKRKKFPRKKTPPRTTKPQ